MGSLMKLDGSRAHFEIARQLYLKSKDVVRVSPEMIWGLFCLLILEGSSRHIHSKCSKIG